MARAHQCVCTRMRVLGNVRFMFAVHHTGHTAVGAFGAKRAQPSYEAEKYGLSIGITADGPMPAKRKTRTQKRVRPRDQLRGLAVRFACVSLSLPARLARSMREALVPFEATASRDTD